MKLTRFSLLCALLMLGGCSAVDTVQGWVGKKPGVEPAKLTEFSPAAKFEVRWHADVGDAEASMLSPAIASDAIYGVSGKGALSRIERATGKLVWRIESGIHVTGGVGLGAGVLVIGSDKGEVLSYDEQGKLRWKSKVSSEVLSVPQVAQGIVIVRTGDGHITGLNIDDGKRVWLYERSTPALVIRSHAGVTVQRDVAYAGFAGGKLVALNVKDGMALWETSVSQPRGNTELERISDITSNPVVDDEQVCAIAFQGRLACYDAAQGSPLWNREISSDKGMMLLRKYLYLSDAKGSLLALDKTTGSTIWKNEQLFMRDAATPFAQDKFVVSGDYEGFLHALNREDGRFVARLKLDGSAILSSAIELDGGLLVQTKAGGLYSLSLQ